MGSGAQNFEEPAPDRTRLREALLPSQHVSSRVAEAFYWTGRYLERAHNLAVMIGVIESLELEELNPTERTLYRPVWNRILPPLENPDSVSRRNISSPAGPVPADSRSRRARLGCEGPPASHANAESILECLSLEAWSVLTTLRSRFQRARFRPQASDEDLTAFTRRYCDYVVRAVPEFFGTAQGTMIADGGWAFCEIGQLLERAIITGNAVCSIMRPMPRRNAPAEHESEIRLSAFLRLINSRDVYRRVYQLRIEPEPMLDLFWKNPVAPRSVARCLEVVPRPAARRPRTSLPGDHANAGRHRAAYSRDPPDRLGQVGNEAESASSAKSSALLDHGFALLNATLEIHHLIADGFLNHQIHMGPDIQPTLFGLKNAL